MASKDATELQDVRVKDEMGYFQFVGRADQFHPKMTKNRQFVGRRAN